MNPIDYLHLQLRLEGKGVIGRDLLRQVEDVPGEEMPLLLIAQCADGQSVTYFDETLDPSLQVELARRVQDSLLMEIDPLLEFLKERDIPVETEHYKTCLFPAQAEGLYDEEVACRFGEDPRVRAFGFGDFAERVYLIERDGNIASACVSARENVSYGEA